MKRMAGMRILVLEDEPIIAMALEDAIEEAGAVPVIAGSIEQAEAILAGSQVDIAVLDVNIHGKQSYGIAAELGRRCIPFVFASGYGNTVHPPEFAAVPTVGKPYQIASIAEVLAIQI